MGGLAGAAKVTYASANTSMCRYLVSDLSIGSAYPYHLYYLVGRFTSGSVDIYMMYYTLPPLPWGTVPPARGPGAERPPAEEPGGAPRPRNGSSFGVGAWFWGHIHYG